MAANPDLSQWFTPSWACEALIEHYFPDLSMFDRVIEPSCGEGAFLKALPDYVPALGVEIDPALAQRARAESGREVIVGDFRTVDIPFAPTLVLGNPPFKQSIIQGFFDRAWQLLPDEGRVGMIVPAYCLQVPSVVERLNRRWGIRQDFLPRTLFPRLQLPLCFAVLTKQRHGKLIGFALYHQAGAVSRLQKRYRALLAGGERSVWAAVVRAALESCGGSASLQELYREIAGNRPRDNAFWQAKVRQVVQRIAVRVGPGRWALPDADGAALADARLAA